MPLTIANDHRLLPTATAPSTCALTCPASTASITLLPIAASCARISGTARRTVARISQANRARSGRRGFIDTGKLQGRPF
jgi:hypothetical protein